MLLEFFGTPIIIDMNLIDVLVRVNPFYRQLCS